jgi:antitoxin component YwqK of YwqJK toxin-antitoxin module
MNGSAGGASSLHSLRKFEFMRTTILTFIICALTLFTAAQPKPGTIYPDGKPGVNYNLKDAKGKKHGLWVQQWKDTRNLLYRGQFEHGMPSGIWERYYPDGALSAKVTHVQDTTVIDMVMFHPDGKTVAASGKFNKKKKEGLWKVWHESGILVSEENYTDSLLNGVCRYFYTSGSLLKSEEFRLGVKNGPFSEYYENGKKRAEGTYLNDEKDGDYKAWFENGKPDCTGKYLKGLQQGAWYFYYEDGRPKITVVFAAGKEVKRRYENGTFKEYYDSGIPKSEYSYENSKKNGPFTEWYDVGKYVTVETSEEEKAQGIVYREKLAGTQIKFHGDYVDDKLEGEVIYYRENGNVEKVEEWSDGVLIKTRAAMK